MAPPTVTSKKYAPTYYPSHLDRSPPKPNIKEEHDSYSSPEQFNPVFDLLKWGYTGIANCGIFCFSLLKTGYRTVFSPLQIDLLIENPEEYLKSFEAKPGECLLKLLDDFQARPYKAYYALKTFIAEYKKFPKKYACLICEDFSTEANDIFHLLVLEGVRFQLSDKKFVEGSVFYHSIVGYQPGQINNAEWQIMANACKKEINQFERAFESFFHQNYSSDLASYITKNADEINKSKIGELIEGLRAEMVQKMNSKPVQETAATWFNLLICICQFQPNLSGFSRINNIVNRLVQLINSKIITKQNIELIINEIKS